MPAIPRLLNGLVAGALAAAAVATPAAAEGPPSPPALRFVTLNVFHGGPLSGWTGRDGHLEDRLDLVTQALQALAPDVVALQEASWSRNRGEVAARLAERLGLNHVYAPSSMRLFETVWFNRAAASLMDFAEGPAILTRFPIVRSEAHRLPQCGRRLDPSVLLVTEVATPGGLKHSRPTPAGTSVTRRRLRYSSSSARATSPECSWAISTRSSRRRRSRHSSPGRASSTRSRGKSGRLGVHGLAAGGGRASRVRRMDYVFLPPGRRSRERSREAASWWNPGPAGRGGTLWPSDHYGVLADLVVFPPSPPRAPAGRAQPHRARGKAGQTAQRRPPHPGPHDREPKFLYLTTTGRRTGLPREIEIWFTRHGAATTSSPRPGSAPSR